MVSYQWDPAKARSNRKKHGVSLADAVGVFEDPRARFVTLGLDLAGRLVVVVWTWRNEEVRLISARKATRAEANDYEGG